MAGQTCNLWVSANATRDYHPTTSPNYRATITNIETGEGDMSSSAMIKKIIGAKSDIELHDKQDDYDAIADFIVKTGRKNITSFLYKARKEIERVCTRLPGYIAFDSAAMKAETNNIRKECADMYQHQPQYVTADNAGQRFVSYDIANANFAAIKACGIQHDRWEDFFRFIMPSDIRQNDPGTVHDIPDAIYQSKFVRVFVLSNLKKLQAWWELKAAKMLRRICQAYPKTFTISWLAGSDEMVVWMFDADDLIIDTIISTIDTPPIFRVLTFAIQQIQEPDASPNYAIKVYRDGSKKLVNIRPEHYNDLYRKYIKS